MASLHPRIILITIFLTAISSVLYAQEIYNMEDVDLYPTWSDCAEDRDNMMRFQCLVSGLQKYCLENLIYPEEAKKAKRTAAVMVKVTIGPDGTIDQASIARSIGDDTISKAFENEALRVVKTSPPVIPAVKSGEKVSTQLMFPIRFLL
jgi:TonB family protein